MDQKTLSFISDKLFTEVKPVLFTDLIHHLKIGPSLAKKLMFSYYKQTTDAKYNCVIMCCYKDQIIKIIHDVTNIPDEDSIIDCFIYAFNPTDTFTPYYDIIDQKGCLTIKNPYELKVSGSLRSVERTMTLEEKPKPQIRPTVRSKTTPEETTGKKLKSKGMGLRSTALLAKMKKDREDKEASRQNELRKRREENMQKINKKNPERVAQMEELNNLFVEDDLDDEREPGEEPNEELHPRSPDKKDVIDDNKKNTNDLEDLLETTAEDSLMEVPKIQQVESCGTEVSKEPKPEGESSSFVDEDGYIVTKRPATSTPPRKSSPALKRALSSSKQQESSSSNKKSKKQGTLESFFRRKAK
ncbi:pol32p [Saccharomyces arboricola H-6]|uniref:Pol32p n=1 Tax=Saccharomyces arboricola (strain H-6 / AS 2.3317 / CBS 10644) TaxID=1160507 RepID=J8Q601_SACAR|nr:pol32p [Saccharomyces arboricola H-6]